MGDAATTIPSSSSAATSTSTSTRGGADEDGGTPSIPVVDLSPDRDESEIVSELLGAFTTIGFCTLVGHGFPPEFFREAFRASKNFFGLPLEAKLGYKYKTPSSNRGYIPYGAETHDKDKEGRPLVAVATTTTTATKDTEETTTTAVATKPDQKETMDIGYDDEHCVFRNEWPAELSPCDFREVLERYFEEMDALHLRLMGYVGRGLGLPETGDDSSLVGKCNGKHENLRLLHYPSIEGSSSTTTRGNAHTDFGTLTLLVQDGVGGLKVKRNDGTWIDVKPVDDSIVVNVGDMLMRWSNDRLKATLHKVEAAPIDLKTPKQRQQQQMLVPERYSIAFFCNANKDVELECLKTCCSDTEPARYAPINAHKYLTQRLAATIQTT